MKTRIVTADRIAASPGIQFNADYYVDPTLRVDREIASAERTLVKYTARLANLKAERETIIEDHGL